MKVLIFPDLFFYDHKWNTLYFGELYITDHSPCYQDYGMMHMQHQISQIKLDI